MNKNEDWYIKATNDNAKNLIEIFKNCNNFNYFNIIKNYHYAINKCNNTIECATEDRFIQLNKKEITIEELKQLLNMNNKLKVGDKIEINDEYYQPYTINKMIYSVPIHLNKS